MLELSDIDGYPLLINPDEISSISHVRASHHGICAIVIMRNGTKHEVREDVARITRKMAEVIATKQVH